MAIDHGHALQFFVADGPQPCENPLVTLVVGPACDSPSWQLVFAIPASAPTGEPVVFTDVPTAETGVPVSYGMQGGECHTGDPSIDFGTATIAEAVDGAIDLTLAVSARSSVDPSGRYSATLCD